MDAAISCSGMLLKVTLCISSVCLLLVDKKTTNMAPAVAAAATVDGFNGADDDSSAVDDLPVVTVVKSVCVATMIALGGAGNVLVIYAFYKKAKLRRPPRFYMISLAAAQAIHTLLCLPFVLTAVLQKLRWRYKDDVCELLAFANIFCMFVGGFTIFMMAVDRLIATIHSRFYNKRFKGPMCLTLVLIVWALSFLIAFPPVYGLGMYRFLPREGQCTFEHRHYKRNDSPGFIMIFSVMLLISNLIYLRLFAFLRAHRRMRPVLVEPAVSDAWTFFGPGVFGPQARHHWRVSYGLNLVGAPLRPMQNQGIVGLQPMIGGGGQGRAHLREWRKERLTRFSFTITVVYVVLWFPYIVMNYWSTFGETKERNIPGWFVVSTTWLTYCQDAIIPLLYFMLCPTLRKVLGMQRQPRNVE